MTREIRGRIPMSDLTKDSLEREDYFFDSFQNLYKKILYSAGMSREEDGGLVLPVHAKYVKNFLDKYHDVLQECQEDEWEPMQRFYAEVVATRQRAGKTPSAYSFITAADMESWKSLVSQAVSGEISNGN
jgi:hypothetical protein